MAKMLETEVLICYNIRITRLIENRPIEKENF